MAPEPKWTDGVDQQGRLRSSEGARGIISGRRVPPKSLEAAQVRKVEAEAELAEEQAVLTRLESQRLVAEVFLRPEEERALRLANTETEVKVFCWLIAVIVPLCLAAVTLVLIALGSAGHADRPLEPWQWLSRPLVHP